MNLFDKLTGSKTGKEGKMPGGLVVYDSKTGNTEKMALAVREGMQPSGIETKAKKVEKASLNDLVDADVIVPGSPTQTPPFHRCSGLSFHGRIGNWSLLYRVLII